MLADFLARGLALAQDSFCVCNFLYLGNRFKLCLFWGDVSLAADPSEVQKSP